MSDPELNAQLLAAVIENDAKTASSLVSGNLVSCDVPLAWSAGDPTIALVLAAALGHVETVAALLDVGVPIDMVDSRGKSACHAAIENGHEPVLALLIGRGANLAVQDSRGQSLFCRAVRQGDDRLSHMLIDAGAPLDLSPTTICEGAAKSTTILAKMMARGIDVSKLCDRNKRTPLHVAAWERSPKIAEIIAMLVNVAGCNVDALDNGNRTPLFCAAMHSHEEAMRSFIAHGADVDLVDKRGQTALSIVSARDGDKVPCVIVLLAVGADVNAAGSTGVTALHVATENKCVGATVALVAAGADLYLSDSEGFTPS